MDDDSFYMNDQVEDGIDEITASYLKIKNLEFNKNDLKFEIFQQAENGYLYLVKFKRNAIGSVLYYCGEAVVTRYFDFRGMEVGICREQIM